MSGPGALCSVRMVAADARTGDVCGLRRSTTARDSRPGVLHAGFMSAAGWSTPQLPARSPPRHTGGDARRHHRAETRPPSLPRSYATVLARKLLAVIERAQQDKLGVHLSAV
ncbi:hypothetical protein MRX96_003972 [Rhipicephalus microplus]